MHKVRSADVFRLSFTVALHVVGRESRHCFRIGTHYKGVFGEWDTDIGFCFEVHWMDGIGLRGLD